MFAPSPLTIDLSLNGGYDDNVDNASNHGQGSGYVNGNIGLAYAFGDPRLQMTLNAAAGGTYYTSTVSTQNYDINLTASWIVHYKVNPRLTLSSNALLAYLTEPSFNYGIGLTTRNGNYFYTSDQFSASYAWTQRFSTETQYTVSAVKYEDSLIGAFQDRVENTFGNQLRFLVAPTTSLVGEYRFEVITYDRAPLDSTTHFVLAGFDHTFSPRITATFRGGDEFRSYTNDGDESGPYFEGNLNYAAGRRTVISWSNSYGIGEPNITSAQSRTTFHTGLDTRLGLTSRVSSNFSFYYEHSDYNTSIFAGAVSPSFTQDSYDLGLSMRYAATRLLGLQVGYSHTEVTSDSGSFGGRYSRNRVFAGLDLKF
jgi:hypothetical protein